MMNYQNEEGNKYKKSVISSLKLIMPNMNGNTKKFEL